MQHRVAEYEKKRFHAQKYVAEKNKELDQIGFQSYGRHVKDNEKRIEVQKS